jgi:hypothetical protein
MSARPRNNKRRNGRIQRKRTSKNTLALPMNQSVRYGSASSSPSMSGSQQPQEHLRVRDRIETRTLKYLFNVSGSGSGTGTCIYIGTLIPSFAPGTLAGVITDLLSSNEPNVIDFLLFRITHVEVISTPSADITVTPVTNYVAYDPINVPSPTTTFVDTLRYNNCAQYLTREPTSFVFKVKNAASLVNQTYAVLNGGWIDCDALAAAPITVLANFAPGFINIANNAITGAASTRLQVTYRMQFKGRRND